MKSECLVLVEPLFERRSRRPGVSPLQTIAEPLRCHSQSKERTSDQACRSQSRCSPGAGALSSERPKDAFNSRTQPQRATTFNRIVRMSKSVQNRGSERILQQRQQEQQNKRTGDAKASKSSDDAQSTVPSAVASHPSPFPATWPERPPARRAPPKARISLSVQFGRTQDHGPPIICIAPASGTIRGCV